MLTQIKYPSIIFIPWRQIKLIACFNGSSFNPSRPIYWADVPEEIELSKLSLMPLLAEDADDPLLSREIVENLIIAPAPLVVLGFESMIDCVMEEMRRGEVEASEPIDFKLYYSKEKTFKGFRMLYFQESPDTSQLLYVPQYNPVKRA